MPVPFHMSTLHAPGTKIGPCLEPCGHTDCVYLRHLAAKPCRYCAQPIGYGVRYCYNRHRAEVAHETCYRRADMWDPWPLTNKEANELLEDAIREVQSRSAHVEEPGPGDRGL